MWKCKTCGEHLEDQFDSCWKCSNNKEEGVDEFVKSLSEETLESSEHSHYEENDEDLYLQATEQVEKGKTNKALWAKSMALTDGDKEKAKYKYINLWVAQESKKKLMKQSGQEGKRQDNQSITFQNQLPHNKVTVGDGMRIGVGVLIVFFVLVVIVVFLAGGNAPRGRY